MDPEDRRAEDWRPYEEPEGYFSLRLPPEWLVRRSASTGGRGHRGADEPPVRRISVGCGPPSPDPESAPLTVFVSCAASADPRLRFQPTPAANCALGDVPAYREGIHWYVDAPAAHFELAYAMLGVQGIFIWRPFFAAPDEELPADEAAGRALAERVIATFVPGPSSGWEGTPG